MDNKKIILISGGFDPIHSGHVALIQESFKIGQVVVLLNSDNWLREKKGKEFLPFNERKIIMGSIKGVIEVIEFNDSNKTCIEGIKIAKKKYRDYSIYFANGGDRNSKTTPELEFCKNNSIETLWGVGGNNKANSSSWILKKWEKEKI
tara:strand:- start:399 stop:842 length:444 start_codon:yes stop_codon:yes gene_type:complete